jgi:diguanylate cyclase (GGDEF)-like protein
VRASLATKIVGAFVVATLVAAASVWYVSTTQEDRVVQTELARSSRVLATTIDHGVASAMLSGDKDAARQMMVDMATVDPITRIVVFDVDGKAWFDTGRGEPAVLTANRSRIRGLVRTGQEHYGVAEADGVEVYEALSPIRGKEACFKCHPRAVNLGVVAVVMSTGPTRARLAQDRRFLVWANLSAGLVSIVVLGLLLALLVVGRIRRLSAVAHDIAGGGDLRKRAAVRGGDEIAELADAFNTMTEKLEGEISDLERTRAELRDTIERVGEAISSAHRLDDLTEVLAEEAARIGRADGSTILLFNEDGDLLIKGAYGVRAEDVLVYNLRPLSRSDALIAEQATREEYEEEFHEIKKPECGRFAVMPDAAAHYSVPLLHEGGLTGFISLAARKTHRMNEDSTRLLTALASQAAVAIEQVHMNERTKLMAITDGLTGLYNHRHFYERFVVELERAKRFGHSLSLIMADVDHFKLVNDRFGHLAGDAVLAELAATLRLLARKMDIVARYGGEEFAIVLIESDPEEATAFAERLRAAIEEAKLGRALGPDVAVTISAGVAGFPDHASEAETLIMAADRALYEAKAAGRNRVAAAAAQVDNPGPVG